eukprot:1988578-Prymnesium_polylepis.1
MNEALSGSRERGCSAADGGAVFGVGSGQRHDDALEQVVVGVGRLALTSSTSSCFSVSCGAGARQ